MYTNINDVIDYITTEIKQLQPNVNVEPGYPVYDLLIYPLAKIILEQNIYIDNLYTILNIKDLFDENGNLINSELITFFSNFFLLDINKVNDSTIIMYIYCDTNSEDLFLHENVLEYNNFKLHIFPQFISKEKFKQDTKGYFAEVTVYVNSEENITIPITSNWNIENLKYEGPKVLFLETKQIYNISTQVQLTYENLKNSVSNRSYSNERSIRFNILNNSIFKPDNLMRLELQKYNDADSIHNYLTYNLNDNGTPILDFTVKQSGIARVLTKYNTETSYIQSYNPFVSVHQKYGFYDATEEFDHLKQFYGCMGGIINVKHRNIKLPKVILITDNSIDYKLSNISSDLINLYWNLYNTPPIIIKQNSNHVITKKLFSENLEITIELDQQNYDISQYDFGLLKYEFVYTGTGTNYNLHLYSFTDDTNTPVITITLNLDHFPFVTITPYSNGNGLTVTSVIVNDLPKCDTIIYLQDNDKIIGINNDDLLIGLSTYTVQYMNPIQTIHAKIVIDNESISNEFFEAVDTYLNKKIEVLSYLEFKPFLPLFLNFKPEYFFPKLNSNITLFNQVLEYIKSTFKNYKNNPFEFNFKELSNTLKDLFDVFLTKVDYKFYTPRFIPIEGTLDLEQQTVFDLTEIFNQITSHYLYVHYTTLYTNYQNEPVITSPRLYDMVVGTNEL